MADTTGISGPDDIDSIDKAAQLLDVDIDASDEEVQAAYQDAVLETHPDTGGDAKLFKAVDKAKDIFDGVVDPPEVQSQQQGGGRPGATSGRGGGTAGKEPGDDSTAGGSGAGFGGFGPNTGSDTEGPRRDVVLRAITDLLEANTTEEGLKDKYGSNATMENVANVLTDMILSGGLDLGDVKKMLDDDLEFGANFGKATGGLFGGGSTSSGIFGGGGGLGSSDPQDYMQWGSGRRHSDDEEDESD